VPAALDVAAGWLCGLALHVAWPPQILRHGRHAVRLQLIPRAHTTHGLAQIPGLGIAPSSAMICANGMPPGSSQRLRCARGLAQRRRDKTRTR
jgi:hypothetical protein